MKMLKGYKGVAIFYLVIALINVFCICNYNTVNEDKKTVQNEKIIVVNYEK